MHSPEATTSPTGRSPSASAISSSAASPASASCRSRCLQQRPSSGGRSTRTPCARRAAGATRRSSSPSRSSSRAACWSREPTARSTSDTSRRVSSSARRMTLARRRLLHRRAAAELDGRGKRESQAAIAAYHLAAAGDDEAAAERYRIAGDHARRLFANAEALGHYRASLALGLTDAAALHEAIGDLETLAGDYGAAFASYETAAALADRASLPEIEHRIGLLHLRRGEWELAEASLAAASDGLDPANRSLVTADRALAAHRRGDQETALELAGSALVLAEEIDDPGALAQAHNIVGMLAGSRGDHEDGDHTSRARRLDRTRRWRRGGRDGSAQQPRARGARVGRPRPRDRADNGGARASASCREIATARPPSGTISPTCFA